MSSGRARSASWVLPDLAAFFRRVGPGLERRGRAQYNKAPFMYELKGALSVAPHHVRQLPGFPGAATPEVVYRWCGEHSRYILSWCRRNRHEAIAERVISLPSGPVPRRGRRR